MDKYFQVQSPVEDRRRNVNAEMFEERAPRKGENSPSSNDSVKLTKRRNFNNTKEMKSLSIPEDTLGNHTGGLGFLK